MFEVRFYTLGCKLNQLETESLADAFSGEGFGIVPWETPTGINCLLFVNTCTVTSHAEQKARHIIRKALRDHPEAVLVITGCYAQMESAVLQDVSLPDRNRVFVVPGDRKDGILDLSGFLKRKNSQSTGISLRDMVEEWALLGQGNINGSFRFRPSGFSFHSRAFLKIQDGCDNQCTYCRTCLARGKSRSRNSKELLEDLKALEERGYREAVLTGVNISQYRDNAGLTELLDFLLSGTEKIRLRLSSLDSSVLVPDFIKIIAHERIRPHFHFSVQSGSPAVLARMGRSGTVELFEEGIRLIRKVREDPFMACDIIAGFPGETAGEFEKTIDFCRRADFAWIHAFPFSRRPGTAAWDFRDRVSEREARLRVGRLTELAGQGRSAYIRRWIGKETEFIPERTTEKPVERDFRTAGITANYLKVVLNPHKPAPQNAIIRCKILGEARKTNEKRFDAEAVIIV